MVQFDQFQLNKKYYVEKVCVSIQLCAYSCDFQYNVNYQVMVPMSWYRSEEALSSRNEFAILQVGTPPMTVDVANV